jgi:two-component system chemotaxis response regulator CheY
MALKVLLVDDQPSTRLMVQALLEHAGYEVFECSTGGEGLDALSREHFDFAFIDINLPDMSGLELPGRCADSCFRLPPILGITSMPTASLMSSALSAGMCGLLRKPITREQLAEAMVAARKVRAPAERVRFGELPIDLKVLSEIRATGDGELIQRFVDQAVADARRCVEDLGQADVRANLENWRTTVQTLHGVAVTVGARRLASATADTATLSNELLAERADVRLLSSRERDCLRLAAAGFGTKGIADKLAIAEPTVKFHLNNAAIKLNARGRVQAVAKAVKLGAI